MINVNGMVTPTKVCQKYLIITNQNIEESPSYLLCTFFLVLLHMGDSFFYVQITIQNSFFTIRYPSKLTFCQHCFVHWINQCLMYSLNSNQNNFGSHLDFGQFFPLCFWPNFEMLNVGFRWQYFVINNIVK
jgi:hypothetical protein